MASRDLLYENADPDDDQRDRQAQVGVHDCVELAGLDRDQLVVRHCGPLFRRGRVHLRQDEDGGQQHTEVGSERVERLRQVEPPGRRALRTHRDGERVGGGLQNGETGGQDEQSNEEEAEGQRFGRGVEPERPDRGQAEAGQDAHLVAEPLVEERGGQS